MLGRVKFWIFILEFQMVGQSACIKADKNEMRQIAYNNDPDTRHFFSFSRHCLKVENLQLIRLLFLTKNSRKEKNV